MPLDAVPRVPLVRPPADSGLSKYFVPIHRVPMPQIPRPSQEVRHGVEVVVPLAGDGLLGGVSDAVEDVVHRLAHSSEGNVLTLVAPDRGSRVHRPPVVVAALLLPRPISSVGFDVKFRPLLVLLRLPHGVEDLLRSLTLDALDPVPEGGVLSDVRRHLVSPVITSSQGLPIDGLVDLLIYDALGLLELSVPLWVFPDVFHVVRLG
mmetsp:Transcript_10973/g.22525  ORF Transcript_10973/g.22525 Transcript_10973/m.22525 type:complete len:206 (+) Transcript_10973:1717-2334(+)